MKTDARVVGTIRKWYEALKFNPKYDEEFENAVNTVYVDAEAKAEDYNKEDPDGRKNFLHYLYFCEEMKEAYRERGIPEEIFADSVRDLVTWTDIWSELHGELYLGEIDWLWHIFTLRIIKLGRLQYNRAYAKEDAPSFGLKQGDPVLDVHIPARGPLDFEECKKSLELARAFFPKFYPEFDFKCFTCHSWLLDPTLCELLTEGGNILAFQRLFSIVSKAPSRAILGYAIKWKIKDDELPMAECKSNFAKRVKSEYLDGRRFFAGYGIITK